MPRSNLCFCGSGKKK
ncbi:SEC-C metal-binding domain-containing protein [Anaerolactibacter massiliensis]